MKFDLRAKFPLSGSAITIEKDIKKFFSDYDKNVLNKDQNQEKAKITWEFYRNNLLNLQIISGSNNRAHNHLPRIKKAWGTEIAKKYHISGGKGTKIEEYNIISNQRF